MIKRRTFPQTLSNANLPSRITTITAARRIQPRKRPQRSAAGRQARPDRKRTAISSPSRIFLRRAALSSTFTPHGPTPKRRFLRRQGQVTHSRDGTLPPRTVRRSATAAVPIPPTKTLPFTRTGRRSITRSNSTETARPRVRWRISP